MGDVSGQTGSMNAELNVESSRAEACGRTVPAGRPSAGRLLRLVVAFLCGTVLVTLTGCGGDVSRATVSLGESAIFSRADLQSAADAIMTRFEGFRGCTLVKLAYDEKASEEQGTPASPDPHGGEVAVFTSEFTVDWTGGDGSLAPNSTNSWTWEVRRPNAASPWTVANYGAA